MRLKNHDQTFGRQMFRALQQGLNFAGMMCIVIKNRNLALNILTQHLKTAASAIKRSQSSRNIGKGKAQTMQRSNRSQRIGHIIFTRHSQLQITKQFSPIKNLTNTAKSLIVNLANRIIGRLLIERKAYNAAVYAANHLFENWAIQTQNRKPLV